MIVDSKSSGLALAASHLLFAALLLILCQATFAQNKLFDTGAPPSWVERLAPDLSEEPPAAEVANGVHYLLVDRQVKVDDRERAQYRHLATRALNERGVESIANIDIRFDPSFQKLTLHAINVLRGGKVIPKLGSAKVRMLQRETELEALVFDGSMTASVFLDDVRVGDVVEYLYTIRGHNPVFGGRHFGHFELQASVPIARLHARLLWPQGRDLHVLRRNEAAAPTVTDSASLREYRWDLRKVAALTVESDAPAWYDPYPEVQWGEFADWQAVVRWATPLYRLPARATPKVQAEISRIAAQASDPTQRLLATLRFVQREIRYLGVEIGADSHAPSQPELVLERRFGDCKDKTLLTIAMLHGLGIEAAPALVNTSARRSLKTWRPSPGAFNHVVVRARIGGSDVWIDPTRAPQQGAGLAQLVQADYGPALVIDDASDGLVPMAGEIALTQRREVRAVLDASEGIDKPVKLTVTTTLVSGAADTMREVLRTQSRESLQKQYVNYYTESYAGTTVATPLEVFDDPAANRLVLTEHYSIKDFWQRVEKNHRFEGHIHVPELMEYLRQPRTQVRGSPLFVNHPAELVHRTEVMLPSDWQIQPDTVTIDDPAFEFRRNEAWNGHTLVLDDHYKSRLDHVAAADVVRYTANLEKARQVVGYQLYQKDAATQAADAAPHWLPTVLGCLAFIGFVVIAVHVYRWNPEPRPLIEPTDSTYLRGLGGWLVLVAIGFPLSLYRVGHALWNDLPSYTTGTWLALTTTGGEAYHWLWQPALLFELAANLALLVGYSLVAVLFVQKRTSLPRAYIVVMIFATAVSVLDMVLTSAIPVAAKAVTAKDWSDVVRTVVSCAIWVAYFIRSRRVRATFVERRAEARPRMAPEALPA